MKMLSLKGNYHSKSGKFISTSLHIKNIFKKKIVSNLINCTINTDTL